MISWLSEIARRYLPEAIFNVYDLYFLFWADAWRLLSGRFRATGIENCDRPKKMLQLYEFQGDKNCVIVRETLSVLDIDHIVYPCPRESLSISGSFCLNSRYRPQVKSITGDVKLPCLVDENTKQNISGGDEVVEYLWKKYGNKAIAPRNYTLAMHPSFKCLSLTLSNICRSSLVMGILRAPSRKPQQPLELFGYEGSLFVRRVKELLSTCELPYINRVLPLRSVDKRTAFAKEHAEVLSASRTKFSLIKVPFLRDPNSNVQLFESAEIIKYIQAKYQTAPVPRETWLDASVSSQ